jgi:(2Fe-2S) ferredoxin
MSHFRCHIFFCVNQRPGGEKCCSQAGSDEIREYAKRRAKELGIHGAGMVRVNSAGCLDRCELGPVLVIYPEGVWYTYIDKSDIDEILEEHVLNGRVVERLRI